MRKRKNIQETAKKAADGDKAALNVIILLAPAGALDSTNPVDYAKRLIEDGDERKKLEDDDDTYADDATDEDAGEGWRTEDFEEE